jgi:hypothetical protein
MPRPAPWPLLPPWMKPIRWHRSRGRLWVRFCGSPALVFENRRVIPPPFSERERIRKPLRIGPFAVWMNK